MITDERQRFVLARLDATRLWRYDRRWRKTTTFEPAQGRPFWLAEGSHHVVVVTADEPGSERFTASVVPASDPERPLATATFDGAWSFSDDRRAWALVPEYVLVASGDERNLLRIADDAALDPLLDVGEVTSVTHVPNSRLVILAGAGAYVVYDAVSRRAIRRFELASKNLDPTVRFRSEDEMWVNDVDTMLKIEAKQFEVIDAAGTEAEDGEASQANDEAPGSEEGSDKEAGRFGGWTFAMENELCAVTRPGFGDVMVLDTLTMLPVGRAVFRSAEPLDAVLVQRNTVIGMDRSGRALRSRIKRIRIRYESDETAPQNPSS